MDKNKFLEILKNLQAFKSQEEIMLHYLHNSPPHDLNLEFGVFEGKTINLCSSMYKDRQFYGFDTFEGLPEDWRDGFPKGFFNLNGNLPKIN